MDTDRASGSTPEVPKLTSANDDAFAPPPGQVRRLVLFEGPTRVTRSNEAEKDDELWQGEGYDTERPADPAVPIYFRIGPAPALVAELVCGCMAHQLGLPAPEVFVLDIPSGLLGGSAMVKPNQAAVCVATRDLGGETFSQFLNANENAAIHLLREWPELGKVAAFDEWTVNLDRNLGNIIYCAASLYIIDHADAFGRNVRELVSLAKMVEMNLINKLSGVLNVLNAGSRDAILKDLHSWLSTTVAAVDINTVITHARISHWCTDAQSAELVDFLRKRLPITHFLLCQQLGHPQLPLKAAP